MTCETELILEKIKELDEVILKGIDIILENIDNNDMLIKIKNILNIEDLYLKISDELTQAGMGMISTISIHTCETYRIDKNVLSMYDDYIYNKQNFPTMLSNTDEFVYKLRNILRHKIFLECELYKAEYIHKMLNYHEHLYRINFFFSSIEQNFKNFSVKHYIEKE